MPWNIWTSWNVRINPIAAILSWRTSVMSSPARSIVPALGCRKPDSILKNVVLPAPFGPITANRLPSGTTRSISLLATNPPNFLVRPRTLRRVTGSTPLLELTGRLLPDGAECGEPLRHEDQHQEKDRGIGDVLQAAGAAEYFRQQRGHDGADRRAKDGADTAYVEHGERHDDHLQPEYFGADETDDMGKQRPRRGGEKRCDDEGSGLVSGNVDAQRRGAKFTGRDRAQSAAEAGIAQAPGNPQGEQQDHHQADQLHALILDREAADAERRYAGIAHVALRQAGPLHRQIVGNEAKREGGHGKIVAAQ